MPSCAVLLDELLEVSGAEERALADEDMDRAEELAERRAVLLKDIWSNREGYDVEALKLALSKAREIQSRLQDIAEGLQEKFRQQQSAGRKQAKYFNTDRHLHAQMKKSFYCDKVS